MYADTRIAVIQNVGGLITAYQKGVMDYERGFKAIMQAEKDIEGAFSASPRQGRFYSRYESTQRTTLTQLRVNTWRAIVKRLGLPKVMSVKRQKAFEERCESADLPEITTQAVIEFMNDIVGSSDEIIKETIEEVYAWLRPAANKWHSGHKTNLKNARWFLGEKVILTYYLGDYSFSGNYRVPSGWAEERLLQFDRVFHLLDGKGVPDGYISPLVDAINTTPYFSGAGGETEYFDFRCYLNRNLHLTFKHLDLVTRLNQMAGSNCEKKNLGVAI